jgi:hypothetical protein
MGILSALYDGSFDSTGFQEQAESGWLPGRDVMTEGTLYSRMGGGHTYVDMGQGGGVFELRVGVEAAQKAALEGKRGDSGTLVWSRGSQTATLLDILPSQAGVLDGYIVTLRLFSNDIASGVLPGMGRATEGDALRLTEDGAIRIVE